MPGTPPGTETRATSLAPRRSDPPRFGVIREHVERVVLVDDEALLAAARWLWREHGVAAELGGAAAVAALRSGRLELPPGEPACALVCGAGTAGLT